MKIIEKKLKRDIYIPKYIRSGSYFAFLDIETDGLSHFYNKIILIGLYIFNGKSSEIIQLFSDEGGKKDEASLLNGMNKTLNNIDIIYTYNGSTFDIPFITKKLKLYNLNNIFDGKTHIDLIKTIRKNKKKLGLDNCRLKTIEQHIGIVRGDEISGKESVLLYKEYLKTKAPALEKTILKHNFDDIYYLPDILEFEDSLRNIENEIIPVAQMNLFGGADSSKSPDESPALDSKRQSEAYESADSPQISWDEFYEASGIVPENSAGRTGALNSSEAEDMLFEIRSIKSKSSSIDIKGNLISGRREYRIYGNSYTLFVDIENRTVELSLMINRCMLGSDIEAKYINLEEDELVNYELIREKDDCGAALPRNIMLLEKDGELINENIKLLISNILKK